MFANGLEKNPDLLRLGQKLIILPVNGILHTVAQKDTLDKIAKTYKVKPEAIVNYPLNKPGREEPADRGRAEADCAGRQRRKSRRLPRCTGARRRRAQRSARAS